MVVNMDNDLRSSLRAARESLAAREVALDAASATVERARAMLEDIVREGEKLDADSRRAAEKLADEMRSSIVTGAAPRRR